MAEASSEDGTSTTNWKSDECPVCMEIFREPKMLQCGHSLCNECVEKLIRWNGVECPVCRETTDLPRQGLPTNFALKSLIEETCEKGTKFKCGECARCYYLEEMLSCSDCNVALVCGLCVFNKHRGTDHDVQSIEKVLEKRREEVNDWRWQMGEISLDVGEGEKQLEPRILRFKEIGQLYVREYQSLASKLTKTMGEIGNERRAIDDGVAKLDIRNLVGTGRFDDHVKGELAKLIRLTERQVRINEIITVVDEVMQNAKDLIRESVNRLDLTDVEDEHDDDKE